MAARDRPPPTAATCSRTFPSVWWRPPRSAGWPAGRPCSTKPASKSSPRSTAATSSPTTTCSPRSASTTFRSPSSPNCRATDTGPRPEIRPSLGCWCGTLHLRSSAARRASPGSRAMELTPPASRRSAPAHRGEGGARPARLRHLDGMSEGRPTGRRGANSDQMQGAQRAAARSVGGRSPSVAGTFAAALLPSAANCAR